MQQADLLHLLIGAEAALVGWVPCADSIAVELEAIGAQASGSFQGCTTGWEGHRSACAPWMVGSPCVEPWHFRQTKESAVLFGTRPAA